MRPSFPHFGGTVAVSTTEDLARVLDGARIGEARVISRVDDRELDDRLTRRSQEAAERGVFGAPTFIVSGEMFFGNDRLEFIREHLRAA